MKFIKIKSRDDEIIKSRKKGKVYYAEHLVPQIKVVNELIKEVNLGDYLKRFI